MPGTKFLYRAGGEGIVLSEGDFAFIPINVEHAIEIEENENVNYVWFEIEVPRAGSKNGIAPGPGSPGPGEDHKKEKKWRVSIMKKQAALILAASMLATSLAGCSSGGGAEETTAATTAAAAADTTAAAGDEGGSAEGGQEPGDHPVQLVGRRVQTPGYAGSGRRVYGRVPLDHRRVRIQRMGRLAG